MFYVLILLVPLILFLLIYLEVIPFPPRSNETTLPFNSYGALLEI
jgi:hypothetical protein